MLSQLLPEANEAKSSPLCEMVWYDIAHNNTSRIWGTLISRAKNVDLSIWFKYYVRIANGAAIEWQSDEPKSMWRSWLSPWWTHAMVLKSTPLWEFNRQIMANHRASETTQVFFPHIFRSCLPSYVSQVHLWYDLVIPVGIWPPHCTKSLKNCTWPSSISRTAGNWRTLGFPAHRRNHHLQVKSLELPGEQQHLMPSWHYLLLQACTAA